MDFDVNLDNSWIADKGEYARTINGLIEDLSSIDNVFSPFSLRLSQQSEPAHHRCQAFCGNINNEKARTKRQ